ncbi:hypothetical protein GCM10007175_08820 [Pseudarthrobacter scleromae]|uniref:Uncharacterized protein n=1 Tax=Pseudarthrobacter scleromae TaxID=158897 RepID=A0ABQ2CBV2_9MICC|nr:hypothetical protein GCM10007175_08820 [Pseudarthrobacter scleromae]
MVAAGQHHLCARSCQADQGIIQQAHHIDSGKGTVIDVPGHQDDVDAELSDRADQLVNEIPLGIEHANAVEGPPQVPVRCM